MHPPILGDDRREDFREFHAVVQEQPAHFAVLLLELLPVDGTPDGLDDPILLGALDEIIGSTRLHAPDSGFKLVQPADDDDRDIRILLAQHVKNLFTGNVRHGQVQQDDPDLVPRHQVHHLPAVLATDEIRDACGPLETQGKRMQPARLVVHHHDAEWRIGNVFHVWHSFRGR